MPTAHDTSPAALLPLSAERDAWLRELAELPNGRAET
jgi:hypothetical protein